MAELTTPAIEGAPCDAAQLLRTPIHVETPVQTDTPEHVGGVALKFNVPLQLLNVPLHEETPLQLAIPLHWVWLIPNSESVSQEKHRGATTIRGERPNLGGILIVRSPLAAAPCTTEQEATYAKEPMAWSS